MRYRPSLQVVSYSHVSKLFKLIKINTTCIFVRINSLLLLLFGNFDKIVCWRPLEGRRPHYRESWIRPWCCDVFLYYVITLFQVPMCSFTGTNRTPVLAVVSWQPTLQGNEHLHVVQTTSSVLQPRYQPTCGGQEKVSQLRHEKHWSHVSQWNVRNIQTKQKSFTRGWCNSWKTWMVLTKL